MTHTMGFSVTRGDDEIDLELEYTVSRYYPARGPSLSDPGEPAEGGEIETLTAFHAETGDKFELTEQENEAAEAHIYANHEYNQ